MALNPVLCCTAQADAVPLHLTLPGGGRVSVIFPHPPVTGLAVGCCRTHTDDSIHGPS
jgi:hypothetical protein